MLLPVQITDKDLPHTIDIPRCFLNHSLANGYQLGEGISLVKLSIREKCWIFPVGDCFGINSEEAIIISPIINTQLNLVDDMYIEMDWVEQDQVTYCEDIFVTLQAYSESFGEMNDVKEQISQVLEQMRVINEKGVLRIGDELVEISNIKNAETAEVLTSCLTVSPSHDHEIKISIDFMETKEALAAKAYAEHQRELEERGFKGVGNRLGGTGERHRDPRVAASEAAQARLKK